MITVMRSRFKDGSMAYVVWIALGSMLLGYIVPLFLKQSSNEPWAIRVNNTEISYKAFAAELAANREYIALLRAQYGQFAEYLLQNMGFSDPKSMTFQSLVTQEIAQQALRKNSLSLNAQYIADKIHDAEFVQKQLADVLPPYCISADGSIDTKMVRTYLQRRGMKLEAFEQKIAEKIGTWFLTHSVELFAHVPDYVVIYNMKQQESAKAFSYISLAYQDFVTQEQEKNAVTEQELREHFERENSRSQRYSVPEKRGGLRWEFTPQDYGIIIDDREVEAYYEANKAKEYVAKPSTVQIRQIVLRVTEVDDRTQIREKANKIYTSLAQNPETFADVAREVSDDTESAKKGGLIDAFARGTKDKAFERAAFILQNDGEISPVLDLSDHFVLMQRVAKEPQTFIPLNKVRSAIEQKLRDSTFKITFDEESKRLLESRMPQDYDTFIQEHRGAKTALSAITRSEKPLSRSLFDHTIGERAYYIEGNSGFIVRLDSIEPAFTPSFESVAKTVTDDIIAERARTSFNAAAARLLQEAHRTPLEDVARKEDRKIHRITPFSATDADQIKAIRTKGIDPMALLKLEHVGSVTTVEQNDILHIVQCTAISQITGQGDLREALKVIKNRLEKQERSLLVNGYIASLYRDATIDTNDIIAMLEEENSI
jgi:peptidyl-prolyl cis-trans isomerase D